MKLEALLAVAALLSSAACNHAKSAPPKAPPPEPPAASSPCASDQFVACPTGETCTRRGGELVRSLACHDRAADACTAAGCAHGCDVYPGEPKEVHCAVNAASSGHMKKCGGFSNWACPENMRCDFGPSGQQGFDVLGDCVPDAP